MLSFEEFIKLPVKEVSNKTFISPADITAFYNKEFTHFNLTKARGFVKIIEREYDIDMSEWLEEYDAYMKESGEHQEELFLVSQEEKEEEKERTKVWFTLPIVALVIIALILILTFKTDENSPENEGATKEVSEAKALLEEKNEPQPNQNTITPTMTEEKNVTNLTKETEEEVILPTTARREFYLSTDVKLWLRITYLDDNSIHDQIVEGEFDFDSTRDQKILFGHGNFVLYLDDQTFTTDNPKPRQRYLYENGILTKVTP